MSRLQSTKRSATRRLTLLAGASIIGSLALASAPDTALAANECGDPNTNGATADFFSCPNATYATGVIYTANGNLTLFVPGAVNVGTGGFQMTAAGANTLTLDANGIITHTAAVGVDAASASGAIVVTAGGITGSGTATHGIRAVSSGGGAVSVTTGAVTTNVVGSINAVEARSTGGNGAVAVITTGALLGRLRGIAAQSSGTGTLTLTVGGNVGVNTTTTAGGVGQVAAIEATSGTGLLRIDLNAGNVSGVTGNAIKTTAGGSTTINITEGRVVSALGATNWVLDLTGATGVPTTQNSPTTITNAGTIRSTVTTTLGYDDLVIRSAGGRVLINNSGRIAGAVDFSGLTYTGTSAFVTFNVTGGTGSGTSALGWFTGGHSVFSPGADTLAISASGLVGIAPSMATTLDFGLGADTINNLGIFDVSGLGGFSSTSGTTLTLEGLETLNNSGLIRFGGVSTLNGEFDTATDDRLVAHAINYVGNGGKMAFNANFNAGLGGQDDCSAAMGADCVDFTGGTTSGTTGVVVYASFDTGPSAPGAYDPEGAVLIDVNGGTSAAEHFVLDATSDNYAVLPGIGGVISRPGLFFYDLAYDATNQRHILVGLPKAETQQFATLGQSVQSLWRASSGTLFDRQADLRGGSEASGVWTRVSGDFAKRDLVQPLTAHGSVWDIDNSYEQSTFALTGGVDFLTAGKAGEGTTLGVMAAYLDSQTTFEVNPTTVQFKGGALGTYLSYAAGPVHVDALVGATVALMDQDPRGLALGAGTLKTQTVYAVGGQVEGGYHMPLGMGVYAEPLAGLSYIRSKIEDFEVTGSRVKLDEPSSLRVGLGGRLGLDAGFGAMALKVTLTGRAWEELAGENTVTVESDGPLLTMVDDLGGTYGEVGAGASIVDSGGALSGFLDGGLTFKEGYRNANVSAGLRYRW